MRACGACRNLTWRATANDRYFCTEVRNEIAHRMANRGRRHLDASRMQEVAAASQILIDCDAAGYGWFVRTVPTAGGVDLVSALTPRAGPQIGYSVFTTTLRTT